MHEILNEHLEKYLEGRLPADLQHSVDSHVQECRSCQDTLREAMDSSRLLRVLVAGEADPAPEPTPGFAIQVLQNIEASPRPVAAWFGLGWSLPMLRQLAVAAVLLLVLAGSYVFTLQATAESTTAQLLFDMPVEHEAPLLTARPRVILDSGCLVCWKHERRPKAVTVARESDANSHDNREAVMAALVTSAE